jgi:hypothetical protein
MTRPQVYYEAGSYTVTARSFRARNRTFMLRNVERTQLRRPVLVFAAALAVAVYGFAWAFAHVIYQHELPWLLLPPALGLIASSQAGVLLLRSRALGQDGIVIGWHRRLRRVRAAIDAALEDRADLVAGTVGDGDKEP